MAADRSPRRALEPTPPGYRYPRQRILAIYGGLMVTVLLVALDQTIVATALPHIVSDLGGLSSYAWVFSAYLLCQTITVPIYGKLGDIYGRRPLLLAAIVIFLTGSALCGAAQNMAELIVFRGLQGLGGGGLFSLALAVVGALVPSRDRARYHGLFSAMFGAGAILGPAVGGLIVDNTSWRWIFYVNLPIGGVALAVITMTLPRQPTRGEHGLDVLGAALLAAGSSSLLLALAWAGSSDGFGSARVLGALAATAVVFALFALAERRAAEPILPFAVLRDPIVAAGAAATGLCAMCSFATIAYVPLFVQGVIGTSAAFSGLVLTPLMLATVLASILSGQLVSRTGRYRANALAGPLVLGAGMLLLARMGTSTTTLAAATDMVIAGLGIGLMMQVFLVAAQNAVSLKVIGATTALLQFARGIGTTFGVTLFGLIVDEGLPQSLRGETVARRLAEPARGELTRALHPAFLVATAASAVVLAIAFVGVKQRPLRRSFDETPAPAAPSEAAGLQA